ncbi:hypothetical protein [Scytonema sp. NUACC21]
MKRYLCFAGVGGSVTRHQAVEAESTGRSSKLQMPEPRNIVARVNEYEYHYLNDAFKGARKRLKQNH